MVDRWVEKAGRDDVTLAENTMATTMREANDLTLAKTKTATTAMTTTETQTEMGALATNDQSDPVQLHKVVQVDQCSAGNRSRTQGRCSVLAKASGRNWRYWDQPFGIPNQTQTKKLAYSMEAEWPGG